MCCPLVVDPLTFIALLSFISLAVFFLNIEITMSNLMAKRRKRRNLSKTYQIGLLNSIPFEIMLSTI